MKTNRSAKLSLESLEDRCVPSATVSLGSTGLLSIVADNRGDSILVQTTAAGSGQAKVQASIISEGGLTYSFAAAAVTSISFQGGHGHFGDSFVNLTSISSTAKAGANDGVNYLQGGTGNDSLFGDTDAKGQTYFTDFAGVNTFIGGRGFNNFFGFRGNETIVTGPGQNAIYDILGTNAINASQGSGYLIENAASTATTTVGPSYQVITFFQPTVNASTSPFVLQNDVNGNGVLYLVPQTTTGYTFTIDQLGKGKNAQLLATYNDPVTGVQTFTVLESQVSWIATFGSGSNTVINNTSVNDVFYGSLSATATHTLIGGYGINVLKGHNGSNYLEARGTYNDISAGNGTDVVVGSSEKHATNVFRANQTQLTTQLFNFHDDDLILGVPQSVNGVTTQPTGTTATVQDYVFTYTNYLAKEDDPGLPYRQRDFGHKLFASRCDM